MKNNITLLAVSALLFGCTSQFDMQGTDPKEFYAEHPIKNKVETRAFSYDVAFAPGELKLSADEKDKLRRALRDISPQAADAVMVELTTADMNNHPRREYLDKTLHMMGYARGAVTFKPSSALAQDMVRIHITYLAVISPDCPDWRRSPVTTYSNTTQGNFKCAQEVNFGLMVADPHDLVRGATPEYRGMGDRDAQVIQDYHGGKDYMPGTLSAGSTSGGNTSGATSSAVATGTSGLTGSGGR